jgi:hypothetical protein
LHYERQLSGGQFNGSSVADRPEAADHYSSIKKDAADLSGGKTVNMESHYG